MNNNDHDVSLQVNADPSFLPLATAFVEKAAVGLGLPEPQALALTLATEEIFAYLCRLISPENKIHIHCKSGGYFVRADFSFPVEDFNMKAFNLTTTVSFEDEASLDEMGLLIASRTVDHFQVSEEKSQGIQLTMIKEKTYPPFDPETPVTARPLDDYGIREPALEELKVLTLLINRFYPAHLLHKPFKYPGKVVDMVRSGEYRADIVVDKTGHIGGGIIWHWSGFRTVECFGPYLFNQPPDSAAANDLMEACLGAIARTHAVGLINRLPTDDLPKAHFEPLGVLTIFDEAGLAQPVTAFFRQMQEDPGAAVWCHPDLEAFLDEEYAKLVLPREIRQVRDAGENKNPHSVLSAEFDRSQNMGTLRPIRSGTDTKENVVNHLHLFQKEGLQSIFFQMDLAFPWQTDFTPALLENGFTPRLVLPYAGKGDLVIFQLGDNTA